MKREQQAIQIEEQIAETKKILNKLRYAVVSDYYKSGSSQLQAQVQNDIQNNAIVPSGIQEFDQKPIHPSLKKLIGKKPVNYDDILHSTRTTRKAAQEAKTIINEKFTKIRSKRCETITRPVVTSNVKIPTAEVIQLTSSRGRNQLKHTIIVGNTSQYITEQSTSDITHKWMCYLKTKSSVPIERLVKKVRFHLDSSYAPNDMIEVTSPPFQLTRRGYGEFPIKLMIFFRDEVNLKPVQIHHQLALDKKFSGHQTLGNETISELWTRNFLTQDENDERQSVLNELENRKNPLLDHDYCKIENYDDKADVKVKEETVKLKDEMKIRGSKTSLKVNQKVVDWLNIHKNLLSSTMSQEKPSFDVNVDEPVEKDEEIETFRVSQNFALEEKFIEMSCKEIDIKSSKIDQNAKLLLITILRKFVKDLVKNPKEKVVTNSAIEKVLNSKPEFDFLLCKICP